VAFSVRFEVRFVFAVVVLLRLFALLPSDFSLLVVCVPVLDVLF
jgi:hypothetical protein